MKIANLHFVLILIAVTIVSCDKENDQKAEYYTSNCGVFNKSFFHHFNFDYMGSYKSEVDICLWMLRSKENTIANWSGLKINPVYTKPIIYEPINVIWIDYSSENQEEAQENVASFLKTSNFKLRNGSSNYYKSIIGTSESNLMCVEQYPISKGNNGLTSNTWSDGVAYEDNNHGRVFQSFEAKTNYGINMFYTLGAFSREKGGTHDFISFTEAQEALISGRWFEKEKKVISKHIINEYPNLQTAITNAENNSISTIDHNGIRVFVLIPEERINISGTYSGIGEIKNTNCTENAINKTFSANMTFVIDHKDDGSFSGTLTSKWTYQGFEFTGEDIIEGIVYLSLRTFEGEILYGSAGNTTNIGEIEGVIQGHNLSITYHSEDQSGETCITSGNNIVLTLNN